MLTDSLTHLGDTKRGRDIGLKANNSNQYIWAACERCGKERWIPVIKGLPVKKVCKQCINWGAKNPAWKGGRNTTHSGYVAITLDSNDFFYSMANKRDHTVLEHRLVMAKSLGRCLHIWEIVHHKNHIKNDNRLENLQLVSDDKHKGITIMENKVKFLQSRVSALEVELALLKGGK